VSFATQKDKPNSERFMLVKITPARFVNADLVVNLGLYTISFPYNVERVERNGVALTKVASIFMSGNDTYTVTDDNYVTIRLAAAPSTSNVIVIFYNLFYTSGEYRIKSADPDDANTAEVHWEPRLEDEPSVRQSVKDIISGTLSTSMTSIRLINVDNDFQNYLTDKDSFYEKTVKCWLCINGVDNIQKAFQGRIKKLDISKGHVTLTTYDIFSLMDKPALMKDAAEDAYWERLTNSFPNMDPNRSGTPIRIVLGKSSRFRTEGSSYINNGVHLELKSCEQAVCTNWNSDITTSNNRVWGLCRTLSDGIRVPSSFPTITNVTDLAHLSVIRVSNADYAGMDIELCDSYKISEGGDTYYGFVSRITSSGFGTDIYFYTDASVDPNFTTALTMTPLSLSVVLGGPDSLRVDLFEDKDFTLNVTTLDSGNKYYSITFDNNFESAHSSLAVLDPGSHQIYFRARINTTNMGHAQVLKRLCDDAGIATSTASFTAAQTALNIRSAFSIPQFDEQDFNSYRKYAEEICKSTMGILSANNSFELEYNLLAAPSSTNATTEDMYLKDSLSIDVDYQDIVTQLVAYNPHNSSQAAIDADPSPSETVSSAVAEHLHGIKNTVRFRHVLETITSRIQDIFDILSHRRAIYRFSTATDNLDSEIGDDLQLESSQLLGGVASKDLKIISLDKSAGRADVEATDLLDI